MCYFKYRMRLKISNEYFLKAYFFKNKTNLLNTRPDKSYFYESFRIYKNFENMNT